jgi:hypothetical protein
MISSTLIIAKGASGGHKGCRGGIVANSSGPILDREWDPLLRKAQRILSGGDDINVGCLDRITLRASLHIFGCGGISNGRLESFTLRTSLSAGLHFGGGISVGCLDRTS